MKNFVIPRLCLILGVMVITSLVLIFGGFVPVGLRQVPLAVTFKLTDPDYNPLPGAPVRLLFRSDPNWQEPDVGRRFVTDARGEGHLTVPVVIDRRWRKMPTNFIGNLIGLPMLTDHIAAGAEMEYMNFHWLYLVDIVLFPDGTSMQDRFSVFTRDDRGRFTLRAVETDDGWKIRDLGGQMISGPGYDPWDFSLDHDDTGRNWTLKLSFKKFPPAVRR